MAVRAPATEFPINLFGAVRPVAPLRTIAVPRHVASPCHRASQGIEAPCWFTKENVMNRLEKVPYTAKAHTTGGRAGMSRSSDGRLEIMLSRPGSPGTGTNPEQLFAAGWSACFDSAMEFAARNMKITLPADHAVDAEIVTGRRAPRRFARAH